MFSYSKFVLSSHKEEVLGLIPDRGSPCRFCVEFACCARLWMRFCREIRFLPQSSDIPIRSIGDLCVTVCTDVFKMVWNKMLVRISGLDEWMDGWVFAWHSVAKMLRFHNHDRCDFHQVTKYDHAPTWMVRGAAAGRLLEANESRRSMRWCVVNIVLQEKWISISIRIIIYPRRQKIALSVECMLCKVT